MSTLTEPLRNTGFILSEGNGSISREQGTIASGNNLAAGTVLAVNGAGKLVPLAPAAIDGTEVPVGILYAATDAATAEQKCTILSRLAEVVGDRLVWAAGITTNQKNAAIALLVARNIILR
jgi:hypothetical protein